MSEYEDEKARPGKRITGPDTMERWTREGAMFHRAMLLFAMQRPGCVQNGTMGRSLEAAARCIGRSPTTLRHHFRTKRWGERMAAHGPDVQDDAIRIYRRAYLKRFGDKDLPSVQHLLSVPWHEVTAPDPTVTEVQEEALNLVKKMLPPPEPPKEDQERVKGAMEKRRELRVRRGKAVLGVTSKALKYIADEIDAGNIRANLSDLPRLYDLIARIEDEQLRMEHPEADMGGAKIQDTARVQIAKAMGTPVLRAVYDDVCEFKILLEGMNLDGQSPQDEPERQAEEQAG